MFQSLIHKTHTNRVICLIHDDPTVYISHSSLPQISPLPFTDDKAAARDNNKNSFRHHSGEWVLTLFSNVSFRNFFQLFCFIAVLIWLDNQEERGVGFDGEGTGRIVWRREEGGGRGPLRRRWARGEPMSWCPRTA